MEWNDSVIRYPVTTICEHCGNRGHSLVNCSHQIVYDTIPQLPKDIIDIIQAYKSEFELCDSYMSYFTNYVLPFIIKYNKKKIYYTLYSKICNKTIIQRLNEANTGDIQSVHNLFNIIVDFKWLILNPYLEFPIMFKYMEMIRVYHIPNMQLYYPLLCISE